LKVFLWYFIFQNFHRIIGLSKYLSNFFLAIFLCIKYLANEQCLTTSKIGFLSKFETSRRSFLEIWAHQTFCNKNLLHFSKINFIKKILYAKKFQKLFFLCLSIKSILEKNWNFLEIRIFDIKIYITYFVNKNTTKMFNKNVILNSLWKMNSGAARRQWIKTQHVLVYII